MNSKTKRITVIGMLCAITYVTMVVGRIPIILFLKYDPSDVIVTLGGFIWGPMTSCIVSVIVATLEMITVSDTGILGCIMNIVQTLSFACTASVIYKKKHTLSGAVIGLASGWLITVIVMLLWNYLVTPLYMGYPREAVVELLLPARTARIRASSPSRPRSACTTAATPSRRRRKRRIMCSCRTKEP